ncbi:pilus assembly protein [Nocardia terpenica]|uniref:TadE family protein n=1 Tax=Nocardia terpenica TaxID=455432 RepID=UPI00189482B2|nr:TadE/TadG family type IV pilus assembly protein [Nocardia terpenica]MBF6060407.1 pilus assembly protein [Nocardia terpenica]MBF6103667.1 pilus assembly protein [Nocardia terpenica]MBF6111959.1 pilus assembly protein [Nocardia terpenica]MBF6117888.1 pilus assembly protein [Nocardia terpenica]MBF6155386.1 pilus assembly protein [Nocardia terpenica]
MRDDRGSVLETVIITPMVLAMLFAAIQGALYFHARNVAVKAAEAGLREARGHNGNAVLGTAAAYAYIARTGPTILRAPVVVITRGPQDATAHIVGQPVQLVPMLHLTVTVDETQPVERVTRPGQFG